MIHMYLKEIMNIKQYLVKHYKFIEYHQYIVQLLN